MLPSRKRTQGGASLCPGLSHFAPLGRTDRSTRKSSVITQNAGTVPGYFLMVCRPAGPRENKGGHSTGALRPRQRVWWPSRPENHLIKGLCLAVPSPKGWQTLCRWCEPPVPSSYDALSPKGWHNHGGSMVDDGCFNPWCVGPLGLGQIRGAIAPGPYDPGRGCGGLPGPKTI